MDLQWFIRHLKSVNTSVAPDRNMGHPQVPGSIPAENLRTQIHMDLN